MESYFLFYTRRCVKYYETFKTPEAADNRRRELYKDGVTTVWSMEGLEAPKKEAE